jgi:hypothetical protein
MANVCRNTLTLIGLQEAPESFVKLLSKIMLGVDLDLMDPAMWGEDSNIDGKSWYRSLVDEYRRNGVRAARYGILYPTEPYSRLSVTAPRYYLETKWEPPVEELSKASKAFPKVTFHLAWWVLQDGPTGELVIRNSELLESIKRASSWYLFDWHVLYPTVSLLAAHLPHTLAQYGALRVEDGIDTIRELRRILDENSFTDSPCQAYRDPQKVEQTRQTLDGLLEQMQSAAQQMTFEGVFINDSRCRTVYDVDEKSPGGPVGDQERGVDEARSANAVPKAVQE